MTITNRQISDLVLHLIDERGITANELARRMGRSSGRMSVKLHTRPFWLFSELFELAEAIEITPVFLVEELEKMAQ